MSGLRRALAAVLGAAGVAAAWGSHPAIARAALDAFPDGAPLAVLLGPEARRLESWRRMPDWMRSVVPADDGAFAQEWASWARLGLVTPSGDPAGVWRAIRWTGE